MRTTEPREIRPIPIRAVVGYRCPVCRERLGYRYNMDDRNRWRIYEDTYKQVDTRVEPIPTHNWPRTHRTFEPCGCVVPWPDAPDGDLTP